MVKERRGYGLIELAILLVVSGLMAGFGVNLLNTHFENKKADLNSQRIIEIDNAIHAFYDFHGYLPCPAKLDVSYDDDDADPGHSRNCQISSLKAYTVNGHDVMMGAVPFKALGLDKNYYANLWGNKYIYAIPRNLAKSEIKFLEFEDEGTNNLFRIKNRKNNKIIDEKLAYLLVDHGRNSNGVYKKNSDVQKTCTIDNCKNNPEFNFLPSKQSNLVWKEYYSLLIKNGKNLDPKTSNIIVDDIWMNANNPPTGNGVFLLTDARKYRKLSGNRIKDYSVVQVSVNKDPVNKQIVGEPRYSVINYVKQGSVIIRKNDGSFVLTEHGLQYSGNDAKDFNMKTLEVQNFVDDLPSVGDPNGIYLLHKVKTAHVDAIEGLDSPNAVQIFIKKIDSYIFFSSNAVHNQTVFNLQTGELKRYNKFALQWVNLDEQTSQVLVVNGNNYCGGRECKIPGLRKCGPLMPGETDRDIYGRFVVRDFLLGLAANEIDRNTTKEIWPDPSKIDHNGLYFSHFNLNTGSDLKHPSTHAATGVTFSPGTKRFLVKLEKDKWYKYVNRALGVIEEEDIYNLVTENEIRTFEFCKEGVGVFSAYKGMGFSYDSSQINQQNPMLAVLDGDLNGELKLDEYNNLNKSCCNDLDDEKSYIVKFNIHPNLQISNSINAISCFQKNNYFLYYKDESIGQLNPLLGVFSNKPLEFKVKNDKRHNGINSNYNHRISFDKTVAQIEDDESFLTLINENKKYYTITKYFYTRKVVSDSEQRFFTLNNDIENRAIEFSNGCKLRFNQKINRKIKVYGQEIDQNEGKKTFQMLNHINHFYNFHRNKEMKKRMENKVYGGLSISHPSSSLDYYFGYCYANYINGEMPHFLQFFFPQMKNLKCSYIEIDLNNLNSNDIHILYKRSLGREKSKINFGEIYSMN